MSRGGGISTVAVITMLVLSACPLDLVEQDANGNPVWGGGCVCPAHHLVFSQFMAGEIEANEVTDLVLEGIDVGAFNACAARAEELGMNWNNCADAVAASPGPPQHQGPCSFWAPSGFCELTFDETGDEAGTETGETGTGGPSPIIELHLNTPQ